MRSSRLVLEFKASSSGGNAIDITYNFVDPSTSKNAGHVYGITNNLDTTRSQTFTYDQLNRLTSALTTSTINTSPAHCWGEAYTLDAWANLNSIAATTNPNYGGCFQESGFSSTADGNNHLPIFGYDLSGNTQSDGVVTNYQWDAESQLKSAAGVTYTYDGNGRRVSKVGSKLYWYGSGGDILAETNTSGATTAEYIFFGGKRIAMLPAGGNPIYYVEDLLGTSRVLTTSTGVVCYDADFYPYGGERSYTNTCPQNYKFEGKERDTETGNDDFGARYYSNRFGRWLSADWSSVPVPVPYANLTNPQTLNLYSMVSDDPESFADLDGHQNNSQGGADAQSAMNNQVNCNTGTAAPGTCTPPPPAQLAKDEKPQPAQQNSAAQFVKDEVKGMAKGVYNAVADFDNWFYSGVNSALGTNFHVDELKGATPVENDAMLGTSIALIFAPGGGEEKAALKLSSSIGKDTKLVKYAEEAGQSVQKGLDRLVGELAKGNTNPGLGTKSIGGGISYARARDGARVFFRQAGSQIEILAKASKANEAKVINYLKSLY